MDTNTADPARHDERASVPGVMSERGRQLLAMLRRGFEALYELEPAERLVVTDAILSDLRNVLATCGDPSEPAPVEEPPSAATLRLWTAEHAALEIAQIEARLATLVTSGPAPDPQILQQYSERWRAAHERQREALGISEERWNAAASNEERLELLQAAFDTAFDVIWREQHEQGGARKIELEWLRRFYNGALRVPAVESLANGMTSLATAYRYLVGVPVEIRPRIFSFVDAIATLFMLHGKPLPKLPRLGDWIDVLFDDITNPKPIPRGKKRMGELPPVHPSGAVGGRRMSVAADEFRQVWRDVAIALDDVKLGARIRAQWMELMLAAMESIEQELP